jgi:hypothetical protein
LLFLVSAHISKTIKTSRRYRAAVVFQQTPKRLLRPNETELPWGKGARRLSPAIGVAANPVGRDAPRSVGAVFVPRIGREGPSQPRE